MGTDKTNTCLNERTGRATGQRELRTGLFTEQGLELNTVLQYSRVLQETFSLGNFRAAQ